MAKHHIVIADRPPKNKKLSEAQKKRTAEGRNPQILEHRFKPGQSGNPSGRPKGASGNGSKHISEAYNAYLKQPIPEEDCLKLGIDPELKITWADMIAINVMRRSLGLVDHSKVCFEAVTELREVTEGKIPEKQELTGRDGKPLNAPAPIFNIRFKDAEKKQHAEPTQSGTISEDSEHSGEDDPS